MRGAMSEARITRTVETELSTEELWALVGDGAAWATWMVDEAAVDVRPDGEGVVVDGGAERGVRITSMGDRHLSFTWWPSGEEQLASTVELVRAPAPVGSALHITERFPAAAMASTASAAGMAWDRADPPARRAGRRPEPRVTARPLDELFSVLADPTRREVLERLVHEGRRRPPSWPEHFPTTRQAVVKHLRALADAQLVTSRAGRARGPLPGHDRAAGRGRDVARRGQQWLGPPGRAAAGPALSSLSHRRRPRRARPAPRGESR